MGLALTARLSLSLLIGVVAASGPARAEFQNASPSSMIRSLQFVQDSVVQGDHSAIEMQRHLLTLIDERLRAADSAIFDEQINVDSALIYTMSGGNPETLAALAAKDVDGNFDPRVVAVLRDYLAGQGAAAREPLLALLPEYRNTRIGPYLTLVAANLASTNDVEQALHLFDWARLLAPGTIVEESALRRSIFIASKESMVERGLLYAERYARRFLRSPYAGQFADLFVDLVIAHPQTVEGDRLSSVLSFMDPERQQAIFLRIARRAAIAGQRELALLAADKAKALATPENPKAEALAGLYAGVAGVPSVNVVDAAERIDAIDDAELSPRDRALRDAARQLADAVTRPPVAADLAAVQPYETEADEVVAENAPDLSSDPSAMEPQPEDAGASDVAANPLEGYLAERRSVLQSIDSLLEETR